MTAFTERTITDRRFTAWDRYTHRGAVEANYKPLLGYDWVVTPFNTVCVIPWGMAGQEDVSFVLSRPAMEWAEHWHQTVLPSRHG